MDTLAYRKTTLEDGSTATIQHMHNAGLLGPLFGLERKDAGGGLSPEIKVVMDALQTGIKGLRDEHEKLEKGKLTASEFKAFETKIDAELTTLETKLTAQLAALRTSKDTTALDVKEVDFALDYAVHVEKKTRITRREVTRELLEKANEYRYDFDDWMRRGTESKALSSGLDPNGGFWVPTTVSARIIQKQYEMTMMRELATVEQVNGDSLDISYDRQTVPAIWVDDTSGHVSGATEQVGVKKIMTHNLQRSVKASQNLLDDASRDVEAWAAEKAGLSFGLAEGSAFINGNGVGKPRGLMTYTPVLYTKAADVAGSLWGQMAFVNLGNSGGLLPDLNGLLNLISSLKSQYKPNATYLMERYSLGTIRVLKDTQGHYLLDYSNANRGIANVFGYPIREADDMDVIAAGVFPVVFGDIRAAYTVAQRRGIRTLRDPFSSKPMVELDFTSRVGGDVVDFDAFRAGKVA